MIKYFDFEKPIEEIDLKIIGKSVYLSLETSTMIKDSLLHLIQNSIDHGIVKKGSILIEVKGRDDFIDIVVSFVIESIVASP